MSNFLKNTFFLDREQPALTTVIFNGERKTHHSFFTIEIGLTQNGHIRIRSVDQEHNNPNTLILRGEIEQKLLTKLRQLNSEQVKTINASLSNMLNSAKIIDFAPTHIEINFSNNNEVDLTTVLDILLEQLS